VANNLKVNDAAEHLGLSASTLNKWRVEGKGPRFVKLGRAVVYRLSDLDEWLERHSRQSTSEDKPPWRA